MITTKEIITTKTKKCPEQWICPECSRVNQIYPYRTRCSRCGYLFRPKGEELEMLVSELKWGREIIGAYGEYAGVNCPYCGCRQYPTHRAVEKCLYCGWLYLIPHGVMP